MFGAWVGCEGDCGGKDGEEWAEVSCRINANRMNKLILETEGNIKRRPKNWFSFCINYFLSNEFNLGRFIPICDTVPRLIRNAR